MKKYLLVILLISSFSLFSQETLQELYNDAAAAYEQKDYDTYLETLRTADELRPNHPAIIPKLAGAWALTGRKIRAIQTLRQMLLMDATFNFIENPDFKSIRKHKNYDDLVELQKRLTKVEVHDELFRVINAGMLHPESFVLLDKGELLLGSIRERKIVKVDTNGLVADWLEVPYSVLGMKYKEETDHLWVASSAFAEMEDYSEEEEKGRSMVMQIDVSEAQIIQGVEYDDGSIIGDLVLDKEQRIWFSNSAEPYLTRNVTDTAQYFGPFARKYFDLDGRYFNLQGLTLDDTERYLYFSDYITGIHRIDLKTDDIEKVFAPEEILLKGIDGLYYYKNSLIAIHNGTKPYRVVQYFLDETGQSILLERVINRGGESLGEPTLGQVKDGYFYYLANSPWGAYDDDMNLLEAEVQPIEIRRIKLD